MKIWKRRLKRWDTSIYKDIFLLVNFRILLEIIVAAKQLQIKRPMTLIHKFLTNLITGKTPEQVRHFFNIPEDVSPSVDGQVRWRDLFLWLRTYCIMEIPYCCRLEIVAREFMHFGEQHPCADPRSPVHEDHGWLWHGDGVFDCIVSVGLHSI